MPQAYSRAYSPSVSLRTQLWTAQRFNTLGAPHYAAERLDPLQPRRMIDQPVVERPGLHPFIGIALCAALADISARDATGSPGEVSAWSHG